MKKMIVFAVVMVLLAGLAITNVSASLWKSDFWGNIDVRMDNGVAVIGGQPMSDDEINKKIMDLFAEPMPTPTPVRCRYDRYPYNCDWLECPEYL